MLSFLSVNLRRLRNFAGKIVEVFVASLDSSTVSEFRIVFQAHFFFCTLHRFVAKSLKSRM